MRLRIGFAKGRGTSECIRLMEEGGLKVPRAFYEGRLTVHQDFNCDIQCVLVRGQDIAWYASNGFLDVAIGSNILFEEYGSASLVHAASLNIGSCRLSLITKDDRPKELLRNICTRFPGTASERLRGLSAGTEIIALAGCVETALFLGVCDAIVDIIETGWTLKELRLKEREVLFAVTHSIWVRQDVISHLDMIKSLMPGVAWDIGSTR